MTNTNNHQSNQAVFMHARISDEPELSTAQLASPIPAPQTLAPAGATNHLPLHAEGLGMSRDIVGLPAQSPEERSKQPTQNSPGNAQEAQVLHDCRAVTLVQFATYPHSEARTHAPRPHSGGHTQPSRYTNNGEVHDNPENTRTSERLQKRPRWGVWQDKARLKTARPGMRQPALGTQGTRAQFTNNTVVRSQSVAGKQKLAQVTLWVDPVVKEHLLRLARAEGLSLSAAGAAFLRQSLQQCIDLEYSALLRPIIEQAIAKHMRGISTRLAWLLVRVSIDSGQTRSLVTNILGRQQGMTTDLLRSIVKQSAATARGNITRRTPQLEDVVASVERWLAMKEGRG